MPDWAKRVGDRSDLLIKGATRFPFVRIDWHVRCIEWRELQVAVQGGLQLFDLSFERQEFNDVCKPEMVSMVVPFSADGGRCDNNAD